MNCLSSIKALEVLPEGVFNGLVRGNLDLSSNDLEELPEGLLNGLDVRGQLTLHVSGNPSEGINRC